jgi:hypothetical protein
VARLKVFERGTHEQQARTGLCVRLASAIMRIMRRCVVRGLSRVYPQNLMGTKLLISVLVLLLSGADSGALLSCAASCMSSSPVAAAVVNYEMPTAAHASQHAHHHRAPCAECPRKGGNSLNQKSDCDSLSEIQALKESAFFLDARTGVACALLDRPSADSLALGSDCQQSFLFGDSATSRSSPPLLPLRI